MPVITNIEDLRVLAEKRVPRMFYDYADSRLLDRKHLPRQREPTSRRSSCASAWR